MGYFYHTHKRYRFISNWCGSLFILLFLIISSSFVAGPNKKINRSGKHYNSDTIVVKKGTRFLMFGRIGIIKQDTFFVVKDTSLLLKAKSNSTQSRIFYDSVYKKLGRNKITRLLYPLAFRPPTSSLLPERGQAIRSELPFMPYKNKIIRRIHIKSLEPFGTNVLDTCETPLTDLGSALNKIHMDTKTNVIRKTLIIKQGQVVDPFILADNERILRELPYIDNIYTIVSLINPDSDSVDVTIITKDVWSIGFDLTTITQDNMIIRLYDANFLGLGNLLSTNLSFRLGRSPFFRFDQGLYQYYNIAGSFIDLTIGYKQDDERNENFVIGLQRPFYSIKTKWAGGGYVQYFRTINEAAVESEEVAAYNNDIYCWLGRSFLLNESVNKTRFVLMESYYRRDFTSRPLVTIDTNIGYYNVTQLFTGIALSRNKYYLTDYVRQFGKTENIPYGSLYQLTIGPEFSEFYTRLYGGAEISLGNFFRKFGYLSGRIKFGGYLNKGSIEDEVVKLGVRYFTPLLMTPNKKYKFRSYLYSDYKYGFNFRSNTTTYTSIAEEMQISQHSSDSMYRGVHSLAFNFATVMYTPWYFYGFKFGIIGYLQGGIVSAKGKSLIKNPFYSGIGLGLLIKNDNLIFPTLMIRGFIYPTVAQTNPYFQIKFVNDIGFSLPDFNVSGTRTENLQN
jgi:hypothetical protein